MRLFVRGTLAVAIVTLASGCAARRPPLDPALPGRAGALVREGCYDCLLEAREIYGRLHADGRVADAAIRLFEVNLLVALREKELALDPSETIARTRALVPQLPPAVEAARYVGVLEIVAPDERGTPKQLRGPILEAMMRPEYRARSLGWVMQGSLDPLVLEYLMLAVECVRPTFGDRSVPVAAASGPLMTYRRAICSASPDGAALEQLMTDVPRFVEGGLFLARAALVGRTGPGALAFTEKSRSAARAHLDAASVRFETSPALRYELGVVAQIEGDLRRAAGHYGDVLALQPEHEDARLGRAMAFTYLNDPERAVADATILIDAAAYNRGEAYYWRAFNRHRAKALGEARADIEQAKTLASSSRVLTLAGMIEFDQKQLAEATRDLLEAVRLEASNCVARWYLGVVRHAGEEWMPSGEAFAGAMRCYDAAAAASERARTEMAAREDLDAAFRTRQIAGFDAAIKEDRSQESASALNAAIGYARGGDTTTAEQYINQAARDPERRLMAEDLRQVMKGPR